MADSKRKCRKYSSEHLKLGFICRSRNRSLPMLREHLMKVHPESMCKSLVYFRELRDKILNRQTLPSMISSESRLERDGLFAPYRISLMIAKSGKAHTIGEQLLLPVVKEVLRTVVHAPVVDIAKKIPLSNDTVQRRIYVMAKEVEDTLCSLLRNWEFSLVLDESTLPGNEAILLAYVRFIKDEQLMQDFLCAKELKTDAEGHSIFRIVDEYF
uniref:DUF4371 domain-containing protein n=1 Tax=Trichuris muris TaxID=70415 RepID=A0A5S6QL86_TRIMR